MKEKKEVKILKASDALKDGDIKNLILDIEKVLEGTEFTLGRWCSKDTGVVSGYKLTYSVFKGERPKSSSLCNSEKSLMSLRLYGKEPVNKGTNDFYHKINTFRIRVKDHFMEWG